MTLNRVEQNDPALTYLKVSNSGRIIRGGTGYYCPNDTAGLARLGVAIGTNTNLRSLSIRNTHALADMAANNVSFFEGLNNNTSIRRLAIANCDLSAGMGRDILNEVVANNTNLTSITLIRCTLGNGGTGVLTSAVTRCTNLADIGLLSCSIDDDILADFVSGIRGCHQLNVLDLSMNNFGRAGCEALATMLNDPNGNLRSLNLRNNNRIDDNCATILANSLKGNRKLRTMGLHGRAMPITESGWDAFSRVLCNTSSINATSLSNHTLRVLRAVNLPTILTSLLNLNIGRNKKQVAVQKILRHHAHLDMEPFLEWDLKVLPLVVSWFDRARDSDPENSGAHVDTKKLSAIYQFATALPMMFVPSPNKPTAKRKIGEMN